MNCIRCGSDRLFRFEADPVASKRAVNPSSFPVVCRGCGQITVNGEPLVFPEAFENHAKDMAEAADVAARAVVRELAEDSNDVRVERFFRRVYREAYLDGFLRCLAFYSHNLKEGKLKRLRELWQAAMKNPIAGGVAYATFNVAAFEEFDQLMMLGPVPD